MKKKIMILFLVLMLIMPTPVLAASSSGSPSTGAWSVAGAGYSFLTSAQKKLFNKAVKGLDGVSYKPVALVAKQTVAGTNYVFLCQGTTVTKKPVKSWYVLTALKTPKDKVNLLSVEKIKVSSIKTNKNPRKGSTTGGLKLVSVKKNYEALSAAPRNVFQKGIKKYVGYDLRPIALLGTQTVAGKNYRYLCYGVGTGTNSSSKDLFVVDIYKDTKGKCSIKSCKPMNLENYAEISDERDVSVTRFPYSATITSPDGKAVKAYKQPSTSASDATKLAVGTKVTVIGHLKAWCIIELSDGRKGYVKKEYLSIR